MRKIVNCKTCNKNTKWLYLDECRTCKDNRRRLESARYFLLMVYRKIKQRCTNPNGTGKKYYYGKNLCSKKTFIDTFIKNTKFLTLYENWKKTQIYKDVPSIDRIDNTLGYQIDNLQFITHSNNAGKDKDKLPVLMYDLNGNFIKEWESKWQVHLTLGIPNGNICKVCYGKRKSAGGYIFKFKEIENES